MNDSTLIGLEAAFVLLMALPLTFFAGCGFYLWRLALCAIPLRHSIVILSPPTPASHDAAPLQIGVSHISSPLPTEGRAPVRFTLLIPAHNEALLIGAALAVLAKLDYPRAAYEIVTIADNCTDGTAQIARAHGAIALERSDTTKIGKGYALEWALEQLAAVRATKLLQTQSPEATSPMTNELATNRTQSGKGIELGNGTELSKGTADDALARAAQFDAIVILDADTFVSPDLLGAFAEALDAGDSVSQVRYEVLNANESWRTRLMGCALALAHIVKPLGREGLRLSDGLKGNGMCFSREVIERVPWSGESITEDIEYTLRLCRAGYRVAFLPQVAVWAQMPTTGAQAVSQRKRWEGGRYQLLFKVAPSLLKESLRTKNRVLLDRAVELIIPPFAEMFAIPVTLGLVCAAVGLFAHSRIGWALAAAWGGILLLQAGYLLLGMWIARIPVTVALSLFYAPFYILWKFGVYAVMALGRSAGGWKRTERHEL